MSEELQLPTIINIQDQIYTIRGLPLLSPSLIAETNPSSSLAKRNLDWK